MVEMSGVEPLSEKLLTEIIGYKSMALFTYPITRLLVEARHPHVRLYHSALEMSNNCSIDTHPRLWYNQT